MGDATYGSGRIAPMMRRAGAYGYGGSVVGRPCDGPSSSDEGRSAARNGAGWSVLQFSSRRVASCWVGGQRPTYGGARRGPQRSTANSLHMNARNHDPERTRNPN